MIPFKLEKDSRFPLAPSPLKDRKVLFCGDSITAASVYDYKDCNRFGWAGRCSAATGCFYCNIGRDGASLGNCRKDNRILAQIEKAKDEQDLDLIVLHGGANDAWDSAPEGSISDHFDLSSFDVTTCAGGLEELFYYTKKFFPSSKVCFIINYAMPSSKIGSLAHFEGYHQVLLEGCKKWKIPYIDLFEDDDFSKQFKVEEKVYTADFVHPNGQGYDILYKKILPFLENQI